MESIFDGIQRPLAVIYESSGDRIPLGIDLPRLIGKRNGNLNQ